MRLRSFYIIFLIIFCFTSPVFADMFEEKQALRVGISNQNFSTQDYKNVDFISDSAIKIIDMSQNYPIQDIEANTKVNFQLNDGLITVTSQNGIQYSNLQGPLLLTSNSPIGIVNLNRKGTPARYRGMIEIKLNKNSSAFNVITIIDIENYLRGVVPNEMPVSFGLEALKAQSVAARNYATRAKISDNFDVTDSTASQVYYGVNSYKDISDKAVLETIGIYALYNNTPISALYFSTSSGITDDWDDVFANGVKGLHPYLKSRFDFEDQKPLKNEDEVIEFYTRKDTGLDTASPKFRWEIEFTREELEDTLSKTLAEQSKAGFVYPKFENGTKLEGLREIKPIVRTQSGKITELLISSQTGEYKVRKELAIRRVLKKNNTLLPSSNFIVTTTKGEAKEEDNDRKFMGIFDIIQDDIPKSFKFIGGGFGHGVGMSQFGAYALAKKGKKYPEILKHYYTNIHLSTLPKQVSYNDYNYWFRTDFYFDKNIYKSAYLYITNPNRADDFSFMINDLEFENNSQYANNKVIKIDITQYLKNGMNVVNFAPLSALNKGKNIVYQVELQENAAN